MHSISRALNLVLCYAMAAWAQQPLINPGGIVNAASFADGAVMTSGVILSIFGQNLAPRTRVADGYPLPHVLEGTSVTVNGFAAPLFFVSPNQINFQAPSRLVREGNTQPVDQVPVVVSTLLGDSPGVLVHGVNDAVGIFTQQGSGCGPGAVQNIGADGSVTLNSYSQSASPGSYVSVYATGLGGVYFPPPDGTPASDNPLSHAPSPGAAKLGLEGFFYASPRFINFAGRAPGFVGVDQIVFQIPDDAPEGCDVPFTILGYASTSQPVTMSIHQGGGQCQNAAFSQIGTLHWQRTATSGPDSRTAAVQETFTGTFLEAPMNLTLPSRPLPEQGCTCGSTSSRPSRNCPTVAVRPLSAGPITVQGITGSQTAVEASLSRDPVYDTVLPSGSIGAGQVQLSAAGGPDIGAFQLSLSIPPPLEITTPLVAGTMVSTLQPFRVSWKGGSPDSLVRMTITSRDGSGGERHCTCTALASAGQVTLPLVGPGINGPILPLGPSDSATVSVTEIPAKQDLQTFSAPGLGMGIHDWSYNYLFTGLKIGGR